MAFRIPNRLKSKALMLWHGAFSGGFIVAYFSEDIYAMHVFAGFLVLGAIAVRMLAALVSNPKSPLALHNPLDASRSWAGKIIDGRKARNPLPFWLTAAMLAAIGVAALTGLMADVMPKLDDLHEGAAEFTMAVVLTHVGYVVFLRFWKSLSNLSVSNIMENVTGG